MRLAEYITEFGEPLLGHCRKHLTGHQLYIVFSSFSPLSGFPKLIGYLVRAKESGNQIERRLLIESSNHPQYLQFVLERQTISAFRFNRRGTMRKEPVDSRQSRLEQSLFAGGSSLSDGRQDSASSRCNLLIGCAGGPHFIFVFPGTRKYRMSVRIHVARYHDRSC